MFSLEISKDTNKLNYKSIPISTCINVQNVKKSLILHILSKKKKKTTSVGVNLYIIARCYSTRVNWRWELGREEREKIIKILNTHATVPV